MVAMYVDKVPNRNSPPAYLLREAWREGSKIRKRTLANLSKWPLEKIERLRQVLKDEPLVHPQDAFHIESSRPHGHVEVILQMMRRLKLSELLGSPKHRSHQLVLAMIAQRILQPCSKLASVQELHHTTLAQQLKLDPSIDENHLYTAMDWLHKSQPKIEKNLVARHLSEHSLVLYDVSSSYYEGKTCELMRFGYSRDGKRSRPIVVYGVLTDDAGRPLAVQAYPGNTRDPVTVPDQVSKLRHQFGLTKIVLVGDRGMLTQTQIDTLKQYPGVGWISALTHDGIRKLAHQGSFQPSLFDRFDLAEIRSDDYPDERLVVCFNPLLQQRRARKREQLLVKTEEALVKIQREVARRTKKPLTVKEITYKVGRVDSRFKMAKHFQYVIEHNRFEYARNAATLARESELDGFYMLRTDQPKERMSAAEVVRSYKNLAQVEQAFRSLKSIDLQIRPIRHRTESRVRSHLFLCLLAYYVQWHLRQALKPLLYSEEQPLPRANPVAPPKPSKALQQKKTKHQTQDGLPLHSFSGLMNELSTRCRNQCRFMMQPEAPAVTLTTKASPLQKRALELVKAYPVN